MKDEQAKKDFIKVIAIFLLGVVAICLIIPINWQWGIIGVILTIIGYSLQMFWNRHFKD